jgi:branched-chain amino acid aminotransferase
LNGELVAWESATVHVMTHALHYGSSVFEGIRCYETSRGAALFRAAAHVRRLRESARVYRMELSVSDEELLKACKAVVRENGLASAYLRPLVWRGAGAGASALRVNASRHPVEMMIAAFEWGAYLGEAALEQGIDVGVSSWQRVAPNTLPAMAKAGGQYLSGQLVAMEAERHGYGEGIALGVDGLVSEGSGDNLFLVRDGAIVTPPVSSSLLPGITRSTVIELARGMGYVVREETIPREALYGADELFLTGTAVEVTPVRSVDGLVVGAGRRGPITAAIQCRYFEVVRGEVPERLDWLDLVSESVSAAGAGEVVGV